MNSAIESRGDKFAIRIQAGSQNTAAEPVAESTEAPKPRARPNRPETTEGRARRMFEEGSLTDEVVAQALDNWENSFVTEALALRSGLPGERVQRMVKVQNGRTMMALSWKAGFTARFAMDLQRQLAGIPPHKIMNARDGVDYPLRTDEMEEQLALFD
jgi:hypothetical protein